MFYWIGSIGLFQPGRSLCFHNMQLGVNRKLRKTRSTTIWDEGLPFIL